MQGRHGCGGTEGAKQPRPRFRPDQPLIEEAIGLEAVNLAVAKVGDGEGNQRGQECLACARIVVVRDTGAN